MGKALGHDHSSLPLRCPVFSSALLLRLPILLRLPVFQTVGERQDFPRRFGVFSVLHTQEACPQVPFAKQGRSHLRQSLELSDTENLEILLGFNERGEGNQEFVAAVQP